MLSWRLAEATCVLWAASGCGPTESANGGTGETGYGGSAGGADLAVHSSTAGTSAGGAPSGGRFGAGGAAAPSGGGGATGASSAGSGAVDAGGREAGAGGSAVDCNRGTFKTKLPCLLSETGLYAADMKTLGDSVHPYEPQFELWSDDAEKKRWIWLPSGTKIDTSDMDYWKFPVGTKLWKEFSRDGTRVETRLIQKQKSGTWYTVAYQWQDDQEDAIAVPDGLMNASHTEHDIPDSDQCWTCHSQHPDKALGFSAIQLAHEPNLPRDSQDSQASREWTLDTLSESDLLTDRPASAPAFSWNDKDKAMFGYLHANCGSCHNPTGSANSQTGLDMWLKVADLEGSVESSSVYKGMYNVEITWHDGVVPPAAKRIEPASLDNSAVFRRFIVRGESWSMPPLATEIVDSSGKRIFEEWIASLPLPE